MKVTIIAGDITDAAAEALCTSTNPRLSLMMGTGGSVREKGGFEVLRECEAIVERAARDISTKRLRLASAHVTSAGRLPQKRVIHCVASDGQHRSSPEVVRHCVRNALAAAEREGVSSVAMPVFGAGHAHVKFESALRAIAEELRDTKTNIREATIVIWDPDKTEEAHRLVREIIEDAALDRQSVARHRKVREEAGI